MAKAKAVKQRDDTRTRAYIMEMIDEATVLDKMDWRTAKQFLEGLAGEINDRVETLERRKR